MKQVAAVVAAAAALGCISGARAQAVTQADIDHWTKNYDGAELVQGVAQCGDPAIPEVSKTNKEIKEVLDRFNGWNTCYETAIGKLGLDKEPISHVPAPVRFGMSVDDYKLAQAHMDKVYAQAVASIGDRASPVIARYDAWRAKTEAFVTATENDRKATVALQEMMADQRKKSGVANWGGRQGGTSVR